MIEFVNLFLIPCAIAASTEICFSVLLAYFRISMPNLLETLIVAVFTWFGVLNFSEAIPPIAAPIGILIGFLIADPICAKIERDRKAR